MTFADKMLRCAECGTEFIFTVDEQRQLAAESGEELVKEPNLCPVCRTKEKFSGKKTGWVKWFSSRRGYGFISQEDGEDIFVHYTGIQGEGFRTLREGERVEFEIEDTPKGPQAINVVTRPVNSPVSEHTLEHESR